MRILVTAGGTEEPLDGVRSLTNFSTGGTGGAIAGQCAERGAEVVLLHAERAPLSSVPVARETFVTFADLESALQRLLSRRFFDAVIHVAAVGDYSVAAVEVDGRVCSAGTLAKIASGKDLVVRLKPNPKLVDRIRSWSCNPEVKVVAFKLTNTPDPEERSNQVRILMDRSGSDFVVHNDLGEIDGERHVATIHDRRGLQLRTTTNRQLAAELYRMLDEGEGS